MDANTKLEAGLPSRHVTAGRVRAQGRGSVSDLRDAAEVLKRTPYAADLKPSGRYVAKDMYEADGVPLLMNTLLDHGVLHGECMTVTGRAVAENPKRVKRNEDQDVVRPAGKPLFATSGVVGLRGNRIVKVAGVADLKFNGLTRCFDGEEACFEAGKKKYRAGDVLAIHDLHVRAVNHLAAAKRMCHADI
jgi:dihydroxy-acid dehydratase